MRSTKYSDISQNSNFEHMESSCRSILGLRNPSPVSIHSISEKITVKGTLTEIETEQARRDWMLIMEAWHLTTTSHATAALSFLCYAYHILSMLHVEVLTHADGTAPAKGTSDIKRWLHLDIRQGRRCNRHQGG